MASILAFLVIGGMSSPVAADCPGGAVWPASVERATGLAFVGTFESASPIDEYSEWHEWRIEHTHAGEDLPDSWRYKAGGCHPATFKPGVRYVVTMDAAHGMSAFSTVAWRLSADDVARLSPIEGRPGQLPAAFHRDTLAEVLKLIAPGALPPTDAGHRSTLEGWWLTWLAAITGVGLSEKRRRRSAI